MRFTGIGTSFTETGLANGTKYFYRIFTKDIHGNYSTPGVEVSDTPAPAGTGTIQGKVTDADTGRKLSGALVETDTGQSAITNNGGRYTIDRWEAKWRPHLRMAIRQTNSR